MKCDELRTKAKIIRVEARPVGGAVLPFPRHRCGQCDGELRPHRSFPVGGEFSQGCAWAWGDACRPHRQAAGCPRSAACKRNSARVTTAFPGFWRLSGVWVREVRFGTRSGGRRGRVVPKTAGVPVVRLLPGANDTRPENSVWDTCRSRGPGGLRFSGAAGGYGGPEHGGRPEGRPVRLSPVGVHERLRVLRRVAGWRVPIRRQ